MNYKNIAMSILEEFSNSYSQVDLENLTEVLKDISKETAKIIFNNERLAIKERIKNSNECYMRAQGSGYYNGMTIAYCEVEKELIKFAKQFDIEVEI